MSVSYPLEAPTDVIGLSEIELRSENVVGISQSPFTYRQQAVRHPGQRWGASITVPPINRDLGEPWVAFLLALNGQAGTFLLGDPLGAYPRGLLANASRWFLADGVWNSDGWWLDEIAWSETGADLVYADLRVDGDQLAGADSIAVKGLPAGRGGAFLAGDYVQFGAATTATLHKVLFDVNSDPDGKATLYLWPYPRRALLDDEVIVYRNPRGRFRLSSNQTAWTISNNLRYGVTFDAVEAV